MIGRRPKPTAPGAPAPPVRLFKTLSKTPKKKVHNLSPVPRLFKTAALLHRTRSGNRQAVDKKTC